MSTSKDKAFRYLETKKNQVERERKRTASMKGELEKTERTLKKACRKIEKLQNEIAKLNDTIQLQQSIIEDLTEITVNWQVGSEVYSESMSDLQVGYNYG